MRAERTPFIPAGPSDHHLFYAHEESSGKMNGCIKRRMNDGGKKDKEGYDRRGVIFIHSV